MSESEDRAAADGDRAGDRVGRGDGDDRANGGSDDRANDDAPGAHLDALPDGSGCAEIWAHLSERRDRER